jgi:hypothetical protein
MVVKIYAKQGPVIYMPKIRNFHSICHAWRACRCENQPEVFSATSGVTLSRHSEKTTSLLELCLCSASVARAVLHDAVTALEMNGLGVIELQPNLSFIIDGVVNGVRLVHFGIFFFKVIG